MPTARIRRLIDGEPYVFTRNERGWAVCAASSPTDRFHRSYQVHLSPGGRPLRCSCAACTRRGAWCKHLKAVEALIEEQNMARDKEHASRGKAPRKARKSKYPPHPGSGRDYAVIHSAKIALRPPNKSICIYCHAQATAEDRIVHADDCPEGQDQARKRAVAKTLAAEFGVGEQPPPAGGAAPLPETPAAVLHDLNTRRFTYDKGKRVFYATASDLPPHERIRVAMASSPVLVPGFRLRSRQTNKVVVVGLDHTERDRSGEDVLWWEYRPVLKNLRDLFSVVVYND